MISINGNCEETMRSGVSGWDCECLVNVFGFFWPWINIIIG